MKITACPRCGSTNISAGTMGSGILFGMSSWKEECRDCGYKGASLIFDSKEEYLAFLNGVKGQESGSNAKQPSEHISEMKKSKDLSVCNETKDQYWHKRDWWIEIGLAFFLTLVMTIYGSIVSGSWYGLATGIFYTLLGFVLSFVIFLMMIVIIEYFLFLFVKTIKKNC